MEPAVAVLGEGGVAHPLFSAFVAT